MDNSGLICVCSLWIFTPAFRTKTFEVMTCFFSLFIMAACWGLHHSLDGLFPGNLCLIWRQSGETWCLEGSLTRSVQGIMGLTKMSTNSCQTQM